jgi:uncharacterized protein YcbX
MEAVGTVQSAWRYPVKSMRGEAVEEAFVGFSGIYGDRVFAFRSSSGPKGFPYLTAREHREMLLYRPRFRDPGAVAKPPNLVEAEGIAPGLNPVFADPADLSVDVETPSGEVLAADSPELVRMLEEQIGDGHHLTLVRSERSMTDCRPVSMFSVQTGRQLGEELGVDLDKRRFRANLYLSLESGRGFAEDALVGRKLRIGARAVVSILERDPRCAIITLDPETAEKSPEILRQVAKAHDGMAGVYGAVLVEGVVRPGDAIHVLE